MLWGTGYFLWVDVNYYSFVSGVSRLSTRSALRERLGCLWFGVSFSVFDHFPRLRVTPLGRCHGTLGEGGGCRLGDDIVVDQL